MTFGNWDFARGNGNPKTAASKTHFLKNQALLRSLPVKTEPCRALKVGQSESEKGSVIRESAFPPPPPISARVASGAFLLLAFKLKQVVASVAILVV